MFEWDELERKIESEMAGIKPLAIRGRVQEALGIIIKAGGCQARVGELCELTSPDSPHRIPAEVVGFARESLLLTPFGPIQGISSATEVTPTGRVHAVQAGDHLLGHVLDGFGNLIDGSTMDPRHPARPIYAAPPDPLKRQVIGSVFETGVRALDGLATIGVGQRVGIFAAAGVGKSTLLGMLARNASADVIVIGLIGERGREVREFIEQNLGPEGMAKSVLVIATSDKSSMERVKAAYVATTIAEQFRDQGKRVLLMMDSLTRFARAQREIGLAAGEPPTRRGFPPSIFAVLPQLLERAGNDEKGSITALYTVLTEGEDVDDPIAEEVRSILDGHIVLSRALAEKNHFPAIDILASLSRVMPNITPRSHRDAASRMRMLLAKYKEIELLMQIGEYREGADAAADEAIAKHAAMQGFLTQDANEAAGFQNTVRQLSEMGR